MWVLDLSKGSKKRLMIYTSVLTGLFSMWLDNTTTILLMVPLLVTVAEKIGTELRPLLMSTIIFSNTGGASTMVRLYNFLLWIPREQLYRLAR
jgi:Na+/H+ antiporter NhaD/arsenite permease-like protein